MRANPIRGSQKALPHSRAFSIHSSQFPPPSRILPLFAQVHMPFFQKRLSLQLLRTTSTVALFLLAFKGADHWLLGRFYYTLLPDESRQWGLVLATTITFVVLYT